MNYFETDILEKELKNFEDKILPTVSEYGLCEKCSCKWHKIYLITCNPCRDARCSACFMFKLTVEILIKSLDNDGLIYFENFVSDFLGISTISIKKFFGVEKDMKRMKEKRLLK